MWVKENHNAFSAYNRYVEGQSVFSDDCSFYILALTEEHPILPIENTL